MTRPLAEHTLACDSLFLFGYEHGFFNLKLKGASDLYHAKVVHGRTQTKMPVATALSESWIIPGLSPLMPDPWHPLSIQDAVFNRLCVKLPDPKMPGFYRQLRSFARAFFRRHFVPVPLGDFNAIDDLFEDWLSSRDYSQARKTFLRNLWVEKRLKKLQKKDWKCKAFVKHESYESPKWPRTIVSRSDAYKCFSGPWFALIERYVYTSPFFVKHIPVAGRAAFVERLAEHGLSRFFGSDYSSFELHAHARMQKAIELPMYEYMLREISGFVPECREFLQTHRKVATCTQVLENKHCAFKLRACRMSGETCTSLGNGITNLILAAFIVHLNGGDIVDGVVEGDDGLFVVRGKVPTCSFFRDCGCLVKLEASDQLSDAGFCSMYYVDTPSGRVAMRDFREKAVKFGWSTAPAACFSMSARAGLLAAAGFSLAAEAGSCPVLWKIAQRVLMVSCGVQPRFERDGYHSFTTNVHVQPPSMAVRVAYSLRFDISVSEQLQLEREIDLSGLTGPMMFGFCYTPERAKMSSRTVFFKRGVLVRRAFDYV